MKQLEALPEELEFVEVVEDYSEAKQLTQLFSTENNLLIHALSR